MDEEASIKQDHSISIYKYMSTAKCNIYKFVNKVDWMFRIDGTVLNPIFNTFETKNLQF